MLLSLYIQALGWSLTKPTALRRLGEVELCESSCDEGHNANCDAANEEGEFTLSCDEHPTTSCDEDCSYSPPPPLAPWESNGTYPAPPPSAPPPTDESAVPLVVGVILLLIASIVALVLLLRWCCLHRGRGSRMARCVRWWCLGGVCFTHEADDVDAFDPDDEKPAPTNAADRKLQLQWNDAAWRALNARVASDKNVRRV